MDPKRLLDNATEFERRLLGAAIAERPSPALVARMRRGIGLTAGAATVAGTKATAAAWAKVCVFVVGAAAAGLSPSAPEVAAPSEAGAPAAEQAMAPPPSPPVTQAVAAVDPADEPKVAPEPVSAPPSGGADKVVRKAQRPRAEKEEAVASPSQIREELVLLDRARSLLQAGNAPPALTVLNDYRRRFPSGALKQEAAVLRVEALSQTGEKRRASALARRFAQQHPDSPHLERVETLAKPQRGAASSP